MDDAFLRERMVEEQLKGRGIHEATVLGAFRKVKRHLFVPAELKESAYGDFPLSIGEDQTISQPYIVALMTECLNLTGEETVLEVGTGSGYQTAIIAELAKKVFTIERIESLSRHSQELLSLLGYDRINFRVGDGTLGWPEESPFDRIIVTAASPRVPPPLAEQLKEGTGKMVLPIANGPSQVLVLAEKLARKLKTRDICNCMFVPLLGKFGY